MTGVWSVSDTGQLVTVCVWSVSDSGQLVTGYVVSE